MFTILTIFIRLTYLANTVVATFYTFIYRYRSWYYREEYVINLYKVIAKLAANINKYI